MRLFKHMLPLHAQPDQRIHIEEPPIAQLLVRRLPVRQPIVLLIQKIIQRIQIAIQLRQRAIDRLAYPALFRAQPLQQT